MRIPTTEEDEKLKPKTCNPLEKRAAREESRLDLDGLARDLTSNSLVIPWRAHVSARPPPWSRSGMFPTARGIVHQVV